MSKTWKPVESIATQEDYRSLGVAVWRLQVDGLSSLPVGDEEDGWYGFETDGTHFQRWTTGSTPLPPGCRTVHVDFNPHGQYRCEPSADAFGIVSAAA